MNHVDKVAAVRCGQHERGDFVEVFWRVTENMGVADLRVGELRVHLSRRCFVGEPGVRACRGAPYAQPPRWKKDDVVKAIEACGCRKCRKEPRPNDTFVHGGETAGRELSRG